MTVASPHLTYNRIGHIIYIKLADQQILTAIAAAEICNTLDQLHDQHPTCSVVIDFSNVKFLNPAMLNRLIVFHKKLLAAKQNFALHSLQPTVFDLFAITLLNQLFIIEDNKDAAVAALKKS